MQIHRATVVRTTWLTPGMIRIAIGGTGLADFSSTGVADEYVRIFLPGDGGAEPPPVRTYTVRRADPGRGEIEIDFVIHPHGVAAAWAEHARPGDVIGLTSPSGLFREPGEREWQLVFADAAGLPAASRLLEEAPAGVRTRAVLEVLSPAHEQRLALPPDTRVTWIHGGNGRTPTRLAEMVRAASLPSGTGHVWVAGETRALREVRRHLRHDLGLPPTAYTAVGYWTHRLEWWMRRYEQLDDDTKASLAAIFDDDRDEEEQMDDYTARLESLGL